MQTSEPPAMCVLVVPIASAGLAVWTNRGGRNRKAMEELHWEGLGDAFLDAGTIATTWKDVSPFRGQLLRIFKVRNSW